MLQISNLHASLIEGKKEILHGIDLQIQPGEIHVLQGQNGSGKSTLAAVISAHPSFKVTEGTISLVNEIYPDYILKRAEVTTASEIIVNDLTAEQRSLLGIFLANQYPLEIPGVSLANFLRLAYNRHHETELPVFKFRKILIEKADLINYPIALLDRNLNEGFSGGEKKKTEILQLALLEPRYAILDETDSGLDKQAIADVFTGLSEIRKVLPELSLLIITHYDKVFDYIKPDINHEMKEGKLIA